MSARTLAGLLMLLATFAAGCLPYSMSGTASTVRAGDIQSAFILSSVGSAGSLRSHDGVRVPIYDIEVRQGIDDRSDLGYRITSLSGLVVSYKRRLAGSDARGGVAGQAEAGIVNFASHSMIGGSLVASTSENADVTLFGGARVLAVAPMSEHARTDTPTSGAFLGMRVGTSTVAILPEIGFYRDRSTLGLREGNWILVPSVGVRLGASGRSRPRRRPPTTWGRPGFPIGRRR